MKFIDPQDLIEQEAAEQRETEAKQLSRQVEIDDFKSLMDGKAGRRFVWRLLDKAGVFRATDRTDALSMAFREGTRNFGLMLLTEINETCPEKYNLMVKEQQDAQSGN